MALKLIPPGERGNKFYVARGSVHGKVYEYSLKTADQRIARRDLRALEARIREEGPAPKGQSTFADAARRYVSFRRPSRFDEARIEALVGAIGKRRLRDITVADLHDLANRLKPGTAASTRNREVLRPAATILHYAAEAGLCDWIKVKAFPEDAPKTHAVDRETAVAIIEAAPPGPKRRLLLWLFHQGMRISHTLAVTWDRVDLERGTVAHHERKGSRQHHYVFPLHEEVIESLCEVPQEERTGRLFPWTYKNAVYRWLDKIEAQLGIRFTPHMARHSRGTWLNEEGAGLRTIMEALGHASVGASLRYQHGNVEVVRAASAKIGLLKPQAPDLGDAA